MEIKKIVNEQAKKPGTSNKPKSNVTIPVQRHYNIRLDIRKDFRPATYEEILLFNMIKKER